MVPKVTQTWCLPSNGWPWKRSYGQAGAKTSPRVFQSNTCPDCDIEWTHVWHLTSHTMETQSHTGNILDIFCLHQLCCLCTLSTIFRMHSAHALKGLQDDTSYSLMVSSAQLPQISALEKCNSRDHLEQCNSRDHTCWSAFTLRKMPSIEAHGRHAQPILV